MARWGLLPLRLVVGLVFVMHGGQKLLVMGIAGTAGFLLGALFTVHLRHGFFLPEGFEFVLTLIGALLTLASAGPGPLAVDRS